MKNVSIVGRIIGEGQPTFVIAEAGVNHNADLGLARKLIDAARLAGADCVKFQTFTPERLVSSQAPKADYQRETTGQAESQLEMLRRLALSPEQTGELRDYADSARILFLSTPFDEESVALLHQLGVPAFKVGSGELTNLPLLECIGATHRPVILSTGMAYLSEVEVAVRTLNDGGCPELALLHCVSGYPADPAAVNLRALDTLRSAFGVPVGFSDHTRGIELAVAAVARSAAIIEKHFTINRELPGPDHRMSLDPQELAQMVQAIRTVEASLGDGIKRPTPSECGVRDVARRSIVARQAIAAGTRLERSMLEIKRPGTGLAPKELESVVGRKAARSIDADALISLSDLE
ncbi:MAG TPA: N-acetylneuraminate synthase [Clostridia bacterium]|nr:N-acetylneuraminate synthase [Clostridia bacterium]